MSGSAGKTSLRLLEWLAAVAGAITCVFVPLMFAQPGGRDFPFPGLYFIEIGLLGLLVLGYAAVRSRLALRWGIIPWVAAGIILAFVILGGFSIGPYLIPAFIAFLAVGLLADGQTGAPAGRRLGILLVTAVAQGVVMLLLTLLF